MGIYRNYKGSFERELSDLSERSTLVDNEIAKLEYVINGITSSWKDRTTDDFISNTNSRIEEIKKVEREGSEDIENVLSQIHTLLDKYKVAN